MIDYKNILSLDLEVSSLCNAKCPVCNRRGAGGVKNKLFTETFVSLEDIKNWFPVDFIARLYGISMCGNYGDPMTNPELIPILRYIKSINPDIHLHMNTNASGRDPQFWRDLGEIFKENGWLTFSVDGLEDTNWIYRRGTNWKKIMSAMTNYVSTGAKSKWEFLVFQHNQHQIEEARQLSKEMKINDFFSKTAMGFVWGDNKVRGSINVFGNNGEFQYEIHPPTSVKYTNKQVAKYIKENTDIKVLETLCNSAYFAGIIQNHCSVGLTHSFAHQLTGYGISHGIGNAMFLNTVMEYNSTRSNRYKVLAEEIGFNSVKDLMDHISLVFINSKITPNQTIIENIIKDKSLIIAGAMSDVTFRTNPVELSKVELETIFDNTMKKMINNEH